MHGRLSGRALACLLLLVCAFGLAAPDPRTRAGAVGVSDVGRTTEVVLTTSATAAVLPVVGGDAAALDHAVGLAVLASPVRAGTTGAAPVHGLAVTAAHRLAPLLLGQLPRPPSSAYASRSLTGSPSRAPPAVAGT